MWRGIIAFQIFFRPGKGTRQGGVLSSTLFKIYIDDVISIITNDGIGCHNRHVSFAIPVYADDILILAPSVSSLQTFVDLCCKELTLLGMEINSKKKFVCVLVLDSGVNVSASLLMTTY